MTVGENIKRIRKQRGLTQKELGEKIGLSDAQVSNIEKGKRSTSIDRQVKIAEALKCNVSDFYEDDQKMELQENMWAVFGQKMNKQGISPEQAEKWIRLAKSIIEENSDD
jgi:transcriptional regulator with XRE-family HTH domain